MSTFPLPVDPLQIGMSADGVVRLCDEALDRAQALAQKIRTLAKTPDAQLNWETTFGIFDLIGEAIQESVAFPQLMLVAHPNADVRKAAATCEPKADAFTSALYTDDALFLVLKRYADQHEPLPPARLRFIEHTLRDYRRNGIELNAQGREQLRKLNEAITAAEQAFESNLAETTLEIYVRPEQLAGLPASFIASHPAQEDGRIRLTTDYPDLVPFVRYTQDREAARELYTLSQNRAADTNLHLLDQLLQLRKEKATLLGYSTWAEYVLEPRMAKTSQNVKNFLEDLHHSLKPKALEEFKEYQTMQTKLWGKSGPVSASDSAYLEDQICREKFQLDSQRLSEYFEIQNVQHGIFEISSRLYGISFHAVNLPTWHPDVMPFEVRETSGKTIGRFYFDLYPREGKYKHAALFGIRETRRLEDRSRVIPIATLVCNFPKPGETPALLSHREVTTFFHEFGHLLHHLLSESDLASFAGTSVARDFVEAPSQMFEEWGWARETLDLFAKHHQTHKPLPEDLFTALQNSRHFGEALSTERQLFLATLDQTYHTREPGFDTTKVLEELHPEFSPFARIPNTHFQATFGHLVGYDAAYYGYQWALSLAFDLFTRFQTEGMLNPKTALDYRKTILATGGNEDEETLMQQFLGRPSNSEAYKKYLGI